MSGWVSDSGPQPDATRKGRGPRAGFRGRSFFFRSDSENS